MREFINGTDDNEVEENDAEYAGDEENEEMIWVEPVDHLDVFDLIEKDSFVAIRALGSSFEQFHLMKVADKQIAMENMKDNSGEHYILKGEPYIVGKWFSFQSDSTRFAQYAEASHTENALVHIGEIFSTNIEVNSNTQIAINDYRMLSCSL